METQFPTITLSPSRMSDFKLCPQLFKFRAIDRLTEAPSEPALRGTAVHAALEALFALPRAARVTEAAIDLLDRVWTGLVDDETRACLFPDPETETTSRRRAREHIKTWFTLEDPTQLEPAGRELRLRTDIGDGIAIQGIIDRLDRTSAGDWVISDYKCGRTPELERSLSSFFGLDVYAMLLADVIGSVPRHLRLIYLDSGDIFVMDPQPADVERIRNMLRSLAITISKVISDGDWRARPKPFCNHCSFRSVCPAWSQVADPVMPQLPAHV